MSKHGSHGPNMPAPKHPGTTHPQPPNPTNPPLPGQEPEEDYSSFAPRYLVPYPPGPTLEDEKRVLEAHKKLPISEKKNALRPCAPVVPASMRIVDTSEFYENHPKPESNYDLAKNTGPRRPFLEAWRARMSLDLPTRESAPPTGSKGCLISVPILDQIVRYMLLDAPPGTSPRTTLESLTLVSKRFQRVTAPYVYQHMTLRGNGDVGVYARSGACVFVHSLTIQFEPHDPWNPYSVLMDHMLHPKILYAPDQIQDTGIKRLFPYLSQIEFVARSAPEDARTMWYASEQIFGSEFGTGDFGPANRSKLYENPGVLAGRLLQLIPPRIKTVTLNADIPELVSKFAVAFMTRAGDPEAKARLDIVTCRDQVVQETELAIHSYIPARTDPIPDCTTIIMYGPSYGTSIVWDGIISNLPLQTIWRRDKPSEKHTLTKEVLPPTWEELGPGPRRSSRKSTSPYKNPDLAENGILPLRKKGELTLMIKGAGRTPMYATDRLHLREPTLESKDESALGAPKVPKSTPEPDNIPLGQKCAWSAGQTLAEFPNALESALRQVNDSFSQFAGHIPPELEGEDAQYAEFWQFVDHLAGGRSRIGVWHTTARTEVDTFITAYREKRFGSKIRDLRLKMMQDLRQEQVDADREVGEANERKARQMIARRDESETGAMSSSAGSSTRNADPASSSPKGRATKRVRIV